MEGSQVAKASGKVLIAGGYGVLQEQNLGLSLAIEKYFFSISNKIETQLDLPCIGVVVNSPQIKQEWRYIFRFEEKRIEEVHQKKNVFLENSIKYALIYCCRQIRPKIQCINITILQQRGFLSQPQSSPSDARFINYPPGSSKTGLGSSACVIVVIITAILRQILGNISPNIINSLSQISNLAAQNKIGSNFDISTAIYGSHLYTNLLPKIAFETSVNLHFQLVENIDPQIGKIIVKCQKIKQGYCCMLDLKKGSNTRKMVSGFIKNLNEKTEQIIHTFYNDSKTFVRQIYKILVQEQNLEKVKSGMKQINLEYRSFLQKYSSITGVPVQPPEFKSFLNQICQIQDVIYAICPGSGGYDAIFILSSAITTQEVTILKNQLHSICLAHSLQVDLSDTNILWNQPSLTQKDLNDLQTYLNQ